MTSTRRTHSIALAAIALFSLTALGACAPEPASPPSGTPSTSGSPTAAPPEEPDGDCLVGDWLISEEELQGFYDAVSETSGGVQFTVEGGSGLSFSETDYQYTPELSLLLDVAGMPAEGALSGSIAGEYSVTDNVITTVHNESNVDFLITMNGTTTDGAELFGAFLSEAPINNAAYSCTAEGPLIQFSTGGDGTVPVQLIAAD